MGILLNGEKSEENPSVATFFVLYNIICNYNSSETKYALHVRGGFRLSDWKWCKFILSTTLYAKIYHNLLMSSTCQKLMMQLHPYISSTAQIEWELYCGVSCSFQNLFQIHYYRTGSAKPSFVVIIYCN